MSAKHSPTPWRMDDWGHAIDKDGKTVVIDGFSLRCGPADDDRPRLNKEQIVRAVNAHDALVEALKQARGNVHAYVCTIDGHHHPDCAQIAAALALAESK